MLKDNSFKEKIIWNILGIGFNSFNSLFFMIIVTRINGIDDAGIFTIAFSTACILYMIGVYAGRIYQVTDLDKEITNKEYLANRLITSTLIIVLVVIFNFIKGYNLFKSMTFLLLTLYKSLEAFSDVIYGILQKNEKLEIVGKSLFFKSLISLIIFTLVDIITKNMIISIIFVNIVNITLIIVFDIKKSKKYINFSIKVEKENIIKIFKTGFFVFAVALLGVYVLNAPKYAIDNYLPNNYQTIFGIIVMPATVVGLVAQFIIHPYLNELVKLYEEKDLREFKKIIYRLIAIVSIFGIIATLLGYFLGTQVLSCIYGIDLGGYKIGLSIIIISATLYTIGVIYSSALTTVRETFSQFIIYLIVSIVAYIISDVFTRKYNVNGAIIAYFVIMLLQSLLYIIYSNVKFKKVFNYKE